MTKITYESTEELGHSIPLSKREIEEDILEELCSLAKKGRPDRNLRDLRADEDEQTGGSGLSETVDRLGLRKNRRKKHLRLPHRAGTDPGRGMPPPP